MVDEEVEVKSNLCRLRFRNSLERHERRSIRALVSSLDRHIRSRSCAGSPRITEEAFPERSQLPCVGAIHRDSYLLRVGQPCTPVVAGASSLCIERKERRGFSHFAGHRTRDGLRGRGKRACFVLPSASGTDRREWSLSSATLARQIVAGAVSPLAESCRRQMRQPRSRSQIRGPRPPSSEARWHVTASKQQLSTGGSRRRSGPLGTRYLTTSATMATTAYASGAAMRTIHALRRAATTSDCLAISRR